MNNFKPTNKKINPSLINELEIKRVNEKEKLIDICLYLQEQINKLSFADEQIYISEAALQTFSIDELWELIKLILMPSLSLRITHEIFNNEAGDREYYTLQMRLKQLGEEES